MKGTEIMRSHLIILLILFAISAGFKVSAAADTRYVSDMLILAVRDRPDKDANVLGNLKTADSVEVLEESGPYLRIRTKDALEGWVQKNYITSEKPKALIIEQLQKEIKRLNSKIEEFDKNIDGYRDKIKVGSQEDQLKNKELKETVSTLNGQLKQLTDRYNALLDEHKKNIDALTGERNKLKATSTELTAEIVKFTQTSKSNLVDKNLRRNM